MTRTTAYTIALASTLLSCVCFLGCMSLVQPSGTGDVVCTCVIGNDWPDHDAAVAAGYDQPEDCAIHGAEVE